MLTYQVKITLNDSVKVSIEEEWLHWMKTRHVPDVIATGLIKSFQILKPDASAQTYFFHYHFQDEEDYKQYQEQHAPALKVHVAAKYEGRFIAERSLLRWI